MVIYDQEIAPLLRKYCAGCHNDADLEGDLSLESYASLQKGIEDKPAVLPGDPAGSLIWRVLEPGGEPQMPPEGEPRPSEKELQRLRLWIEQGAKGPAGQEPDRLMLHVPKIESRTDLDPVTAIAWAPSGRQVALSRFGRVEILEPADSEAASSKWEKVRVLQPIPGKVASIHYCFDGSRIITASGVAGSGGIATLWDATTGERIRDFIGHRDVLYDAEVSPDQTLVATCSYDRNIILWNLESGEVVRTLSGHNGAVYDIAFNPEGTVLASASADDTCKLWRVRDGARLDTLGQPLKEQYAIEFTPDGQFVVAAGADNRLRVWRLKSAEDPVINPLVLDRFAHEAPIVALAFSPDGTQVVTSAQDRTLKVWETKHFTELKLLKNQPQVVAALHVDSAGKRALLGRLDGTWDLLELPESVASADISEPVATVEKEIPKPAPVAEVQEVEPNDLPEQAQKVSLPAQVTGTIYQKDAATDVDQFRFAAEAGEEWVIEVRASRDNSRLDSFVEVLTSEGRPIERVILQAVRESYFTFRGKNGNQTGDFRLFQWEEMTPNQLLYCNGEVVKLWRAPRGPDSGFDVYPGFGTRWGYFDTSGLTHALNEPCYVVEPHAPGTQLIPNGLPVFPIYYQNDDAARRTAGKDSKLFFTAPETGEYLLRLHDVRDAQGPDFNYTVSIRPAAPDFSVQLLKRKLTIGTGNRTELVFRAIRQDQFDGPITISFQNLPPGLTFVNQPLTIEFEQSEAMGVLSAAADCPQPTAEQLQKMQITAAAMIQGQEVTHPVDGITELKVETTPRVQVAIQAAEGGAVPVNDSEEGPLEFEIHPGESIMLKVVAERNGFDKVINFGNAESGRNLPHGVYVDDIGLNGLMMLETQSEQTFFLTAYDWVPEQSRLFHLQANVQGGVATVPVLLHVRPRSARTVAKP